LKRKQFVKGLTQLSEEGAIQIFKQPNFGMEELIIGVVGVLQFEVLEYRLKQEYGVDMIMNTLPYRYIRWIEADTIKSDKLSMTMDTILVEDKNRNPALLFQNEWSIRHIIERNENLVLRETSL
ncbi:MAG: peptide chain release factor 3, partial [Peptostreptococcaceae bacterium]